MRIALLGYGKMGKMIEQVALARGHKIVLKIDTESNDFAGMMISELTGDLPLNSQIEEAEKMRVEHDESRIAPR